MPLPRFSRLDSERQTTILSVATEEFAEHGFEGASFNRIIRRAGTTKGAMYYYFADKADLFGTVMVETVERFIGRVMRTELPPVKSPDDFWAALLTLHRAALGYWLREPQAAGLLRAATRAVATGSLPAPTARMHDIVRKPLGAMMELGQSVGALRSDLPAALAVDVTIGLLIAFDRWAVERAETETVEALLDDIPPLVVDALRRFGRPAAVS